MAHFEPETITLRGYGLYPALKLELNRIKTPEFKKRLEEDTALGYPSDVDDDAKSTYDVVLDNNTVSEIDRKILSEAIMKNIEAKEAGGMSLDSSYAEMKSDKKDQDKDVDPGKTGDNFNATANAADTKTERSGFTRGQNTGNMRYEKRLIEKVIVGQYTLDFGNVVAGTKAVRTFKIFNVGKMNLNLVFDKKAISAAGFQLSHDKIQRFQFKDHNMYQITLIYQTKKTSTPGRAKYMLPIDIHNGPKYILEIITNVTVPEIKVSNTDIDFGPVICGVRKTVFIRFENQKEVNCEWTLSAKDDRPHDRENKKQEPRFNMSPTFGLMPKYSKSTLEITFIPNFERVYQQKFLIDVKDNQKKVEIMCKGTGVTPNLEFFPPELSFEPSLPYDESVLRTVEIKNSSDFDCELFSLDFDKQYLKEDHLLSNYDILNKNEQIFVDVRNAGQPFWPNIIEACKLREEIDEIEKKIQAIKDDPEVEDKENVLKQLEDTKPKPIEEPNYPMKLDDERKIHFVLWGPEGCGKSQLAKSLNKKHERGILNMSEIFDWNVAHQTEAGIKATAILDSRKEAIDAYIVEKEKERKKKKPKKGEELEDIKTDHFNWLEHDIITELLTERLKAPDCNAGVIFDNLKSRYHENELVGLKAILDACTLSNVMLVNMCLPKDEKGFPQSHIIDTDAINKYLGIETNKLPDVKSVKEIKVATDNVKVETKGQEAGGKTDKGQGKGDKKDDKNAGKTSRGKKDSQQPTRGVSAKKDLEATQDKLPVNEILPISEEIDIAKPLFELNYPKEMTEEEAKEFEALTKTLLTLFVGNLPDAEIYKFGKEKDDPKSRQQPKKPPPKGQAVVEEVVEDKYEEVSPEQMSNTELPIRRLYTEIMIINNHFAINSKALEILPAPDFPDPQSLPIPDPFIQQIIKKQPPKRKRKDLQNFEILTPKGIVVKEALVESLIENEFKEDREAYDARLAELDTEFKTKEEQIQAEIDAKQEALESGQDGTGVETSNNDKNVTNQATDKNNVTKQDEDDENDENHSHSKILDKDTSQAVSNPPKDGENIDQVDQEAHDATPGKPKMHPELQEIQDQIDLLKRDWAEKLRVKRSELMSRTDVTFKMEDLEKVTRWIIPANKSIYMIVRFFSKAIGSFEATTDFDTTFSIGKTFNYKVSALCDFPQINSNPTNIFANRRRVRAAHMPESLISRAYVHSESVFDFGPLLIGKNAEAKNEDSVKQMNSSVFRITNFGKYKCFLEFDLSSSINHSESPEYKQGIFMIEPYTMELNLEETGEIRVWA